MTFKKAMGLVLLGILLSVVYSGAMEAKHAVEDVFCVVSEGLHCER